MLNVEIYFVQRFQSKYLRLTFQDVSQENIGTTNNNGSLCKCVNTIHNI